MRYGEIIAIVPIYQGEQTLHEIYLKNGEKIIDERNQKTILESLTAAEFTDLTYLRKFISTFLKRKRNLPIPLSQGRIYIAIPIRKALKKGDPTYMYVDLSQIKSIDKGILKMSNDLELKYETTKEKVVHEMQQGRLANLCVRFSEDLI